MLNLLAHIEKVRIELLMFSLLCNPVLQLKLNTGRRHRLLTLNLHSNIYIFVVCVALHVGIKERIGER